jgi:hypothetical protein
MGSARIDHLPLSQRIHALVQQAPLGRPERPLASLRLPLPRTGGHVSGRTGALGDCCSEAVADRSGSHGQVRAWATKR